MKLYLDSADARQWRAVPGWPPVVGVTTNPSLIHQAGLRLSLPSYRALVRRAAAICDTYDRPVATWAEARKILGLRQPQP